MKKAFQCVQIEIVSINAQDIITTSKFDGDINLPIDPFSEEDE
jgi:hypothetical protein